MYDAGPYFFSKILSEIPITVVLSTMFAVIVYWSVGLNTAHWYNFFLFWTILTLSNLATSAYALCMGIGIPNK